MAHALRDSADVPTSPSSVLRIAVTTGEPAGVGPELMYALTCQDPATIALQARCAPGALCAAGASGAAGSASGDAGVGAAGANAPCGVELVLIGDRQLLAQRMALLGSNFELHDFDPGCSRVSGPDAKGVGHISCMHVPLGAPAVAGRLDPANADYVLATLDRAIEGCQSGLFDAMVTAPISKSVIAHTGREFTGHTEYLQEKCGCEEVVMMLGCSKMNVALATTHLPLSEVSAAITREKLSGIITILHRDLKERMGFEDPAIYVCGINPHAGEDGTLGREELDTVIPVLETLRREQGMKLVGPLPADTIFQPRYLDDAAAILTMYHDQGLPVLKYVGFDSGYNTTLGLPFIRTSVDHGTAMDLAGTGKADTGSLLSAVSLAIYMAANARRSGR